VAEHRVASLADVVNGRPVTVDIEGTRVVLARVDEAVYACGDVCTHRGGSLGEGRLRGARLACPLHGWIFDVRTGKCQVPSRGDAVPTFPVRLDGESVFIELP
jgi:3-phenylpropionate/trans-cinnamate dioxygenase ferredoxin component